jgi:hypothetical protein
MDGFEEFYNWFSNCDSSRYIARKLPRGMKKPPCKCNVKDGDRQAICFGPLSAPKNRHYWRCSVCKEPIPEQSNPTTNRENINAENIF